MEKQKVVIVLPAYNAAQTLKKTYYDIPEKYREHVLLVDDFSRDETSKVAEDLKIKVVRHTKNLGYGGNQKTCYRESLKMNADIIVMIHPDYQYDPKLIPAMVEMINSGNYDCILGSRIIDGNAVKGGMPIYKYLFNRLLTLVENMCTGAKVSEYHTGLRAYRADVLKNINFENNSDDFIFDNQILLQILSHSYRIGEISCPCKYFAEASSINFVRSSVYGIGCLYWGFTYLLARLNLYHHPLLFHKKK